MGQVASRRRHHYLSTELKKKKKAKEYPLEIWRQVKDVEIIRLQELTKENEKEFERVKKKIVCHSVLLKEIFEDTLRMQKETHDKEIAELKKEIAELKKAMETNKQ
jgi:hypothetical protein